MREIKFRGVCKDNGEYVYGDLIHRHKKIFILPFNEEEKIEVKSAAQFVEQNWLDGREYYEGDKVLRCREGKVVSKKIAALYSNLDF